MPLRPGWRSFFYFVPTFATDDYLVQLSAGKVGIGAMVRECHTYPHPRSGEVGKSEVDLRNMSGEFHLVCPKFMRFVPRWRAVAGLMLGEIGRHLPRPVQSTTLPI